jgi:hypothetical protein
VRELILKMSISLDGLVGGSEGELRSYGEERGCMCFYRQ